MIRLTVLLCGGIFLALLIAGEDVGQVRDGLKNQPVAAVKTTSVATAAPTPVASPEPQITEAVFVPAQPVRVAPATPEPAPKPAVVEVAEPAAQPDTRLAVVSSRSVNVRSGPSTSDAIIGRLTNGEQVLVIQEANPVDGWSLVRIEGDGFEGYVASRLLQDVAP